MKEDFANWINSLFNWLNPSRRDNKYIDDDLYNGRRTVKRRNHSTSIKRYVSLLIGIVVVVLLVLGIGKGLKHFSFGNQTTTIQKNLDSMYVDANHSDLKKNVNQTDIDKINTKINKLKAGKKTASFQKESAELQANFNVKDNYDNLYNNENHVADKANSKDVDQQLKNLKANVKVSSDFKNNYQQKLNDTKKILQETDKLSKRYELIMEDIKYKVAVDPNVVEKLINDMNNNKNSQKTLNQQTKLISLKSQIKKDYKKYLKDEANAKAAAEQAQREADAKAAAEEAEAESSAAASRAASQSEATAEANAAAAASASSDDSTSDSNSYSSDSDTSSYNSNTSSYAGTGYSTKSNKSTTKYNY